MKASLQALFDDVVAHPEDDGRRLVYADALTAEDDPRGEFITVQCRLAAAKGTSAQLKALRTREHELLEAHRGEWVGPLEQFLKKNDAYGLSKLELRRGFVFAARAQMSSPEVLPTLFRLAPLLERLSLRGDAVDFHPRLSFLTHLDAAGDCAVSVAEWVSTRRFERLTHLTVEFDVGPERSLLLDGQPVLQSLEVQEGSVAKAVTLPPTLERLTWPGFTWCEQLASLTKLHTLRVGFTKLEPLMLTAVASKSRQLTVLELNTKDEAALAKLLACPWPMLEQLDLSNSKLGQKGAALVAALDAPKLRTLDLANTSLTGPGAWKVLRSPLMKSLTQVSLRGNRLTDADLVELPKLKHELALLNLKKNKLSAAFLAKLAKTFPETRFSR